MAQSGDQRELDGGRPPSHGGPSEIAASLERRIRSVETRRYASLRGLPEQCAELTAEAEQRGDRYGAIRIRLVATNVLGRGGQGAPARAEQLRLHAEAQPWPSLARRARMMLAASAARLGERAEAMRWMRECLDGWPDDERPEWRAEALMTAALLSVSRSGVDYTLVRHAITQIRAHCDRQIVLVALANFAETAAECGDQTIAAEFADTAEELLERQPELVTPLVLDSIAQARLAGGDPDAAERALRTAIELEATMGCADVMGDPWLTLSQVQVDRHRPAEALVLLDHPRRLRWAARSPWTMTREYRLRATILSDLGRWQEAYVALRAHLEVYEVIRSVEGDRAVVEAAGWQSLDEERRRARAFERLALTDSLTGLANRRQVDRWLDPSAASFDGGGEAFGAVAGATTVAILDLDHFKRVNDTYSHSAGDDVLRQFARMLNHFCLEQREQGEDVVAARLGGEEFLLLWRGCAPEQARTTGLAVLAQIRRHQFGITDARVGVTANIALTASIGLAHGVLQVGGANLLELADRHLYQAKQLGRDRLVSDDPPARPVGGHCAEQEVDAVFSQNGI